MRWLGAGNLEVNGLDPTLYINITIPMHMIVVQSRKCSSLGMSRQLSVSVYSIFPSYLHLCVTLGAFQL